MKITIEASDLFAVLHGVSCRIWRGVTPQGNQVEVLVPFIRCNDAASDEISASLRARPPPTAVPAHWYRNARDGMLN